ncbi:MAG: DNA repair protein RecN [Clostridiales bacterium]|nr:DNA repair protein RecN [Clostridiales bacterium]
MLTRLRISKLAIIDALDVEFSSGFSAFTGETGAGKSILIEAIGFILGERAGRELIQSGAKKAWVEACFILPDSAAARAFLRERELPDENELILYREMNDAGRGSCRVNGTLVTTAEFAELGDLLADLHGQHAHQSLLRVKNHTDLLDTFYRNNADGLLGELKSARTAALSAKKSLAALREGAMRREHRLDLLRYQIKEIRAADLQSGEEEQLNEDRKCMHNAQSITEGLQNAYEALYGDEGALSRLTAAQAALAPITAFHADYLAAAARTDESYFAAEDAAFALRDALADFRFDPEMLEDTENRLALIHGLKRKYGRDIPEILSYLRKAELEVEELEGGEESEERLTSALAKASAEYTRLATLLTERRIAAAQALKSKLETELRKLGMPHAAVTVQLHAQNTENFPADGAETAEFMLSANLGEAEKPLAKVASGGEISRIMLAFKAALANADSIGTLIFDEIDSGISGLIANAVAQKMRRLGRSRQLLCVTHLPQIAAAADTQYLVYKQEADGKTRSDVARLTDAERPAELARIMGGTADNAAAHAHAAELLAQMQANR